MYGCVCVGEGCLCLRLRVRVFAYGCLIVNKCVGVYIKTQVCVCGCWGVKGFVFLIKE